MAVLSTKGQLMLKKLVQLYPDFGFTAGKAFAWSPATRTVIYEERLLTDGSGTLSLLHELSHGLLDHQTFAFDIELMQMEIEAWERARQLADQLSVPVDEDYIHECLETYREWLYRRSRCPGCKEAGVQLEESFYHCLVCSSKWKVTQNRHTQTYRKLISK